MLLKKKKWTRFYVGFALWRRHSAKLPEYMAQLFNFGDTALIKVGQAIKTKGKLRAKVPGNSGHATSAGNKPTAENCHRIKHVPTNRVKA